MLLGPQPPTIPLALFKEPLQIPLAPLREPLQIRLALSVPLEMRLAPLREPLEMRLALVKEPLESQQARAKFFHIISLYHSADGNKEKPGQFDLSSRATATKSRVRL